MSAPLLPDGGLPPLALNAPAHLQMARLLDALLVLQAEGSAPVAELASRVGVQPDRLRQLLSAWMVAAPDAVGTAAPFSISFGTSQGPLGPGEEDDAAQASADVVHLDRPSGAALLDDVARQAVSVDDVARGLLSARALLHDGTLDDRHRALIEGLVAKLEQALALTTTSPLGATADALRRAVAQRRAVRFRYRDPWRGTDDRVQVEPYDVRRRRDRLVLDAGASRGLPWRTFDVSSISELEVLDGAVGPRPALPDRAQRDAPVQVVVRVPERSAAERRLTAGWDGRVTGPAVGGTIDVRIALDRADEARLGVLLLQLGPLCEVVSPAELRGVAAPVAERLLAGLPEGD